MKDAYNLDSITPASMNYLLQKMKTNDTLFKKYIDYNSVLWSPSLPQGEFRAAQLCSIEFPDLDEYNDCMSNASQSTSTSANPNDSDPSNVNKPEIILKLLSLSAFILLI